MKKMFVLITLFILLATTLACISDPAPKVTIGTEIVVTSVYRNSIGHTYCEGTIQNLTSYNVKFVKVLLKGYDSNGALVNNRAWYIDSDILYGKKSSTWSGFLDDPNGVIATCQASLESYRLAD